MKLYSYFRSSASYRVRIGLALKGLNCDDVPVRLARNEHLGTLFSAVSAARLVALLEDDGQLPTQSMAILEYLDEVHPEPSLLPGDTFARARIRALAQDVACEIHPLDNLRVLRYLVHDLKVSEDDKDRWYRHWCDAGLAVVEHRLAGSAATGRICHGDTPTLADCVLVAQIHNAQRMACRLDHVPTAMRVFEACMALDAFVKTQPSACPDAG